jgi:hypothetical protein
MHDQDRYTLAGLASSRDSPCAAHGNLKRTLTSAATELSATKKSPSHLGRGLLQRADRWPLKWIHRICESNFRGAVQCAGSLFSLCKENLGGQRLAAWGWRLWCSRAQPGTAGAPEVSRRSSMTSSARLGSAAGLSSVRLQPVPMLTRFLVGAVFLGSR